jgi:hypothetical protein
MMDAGLKMLAIERNYSGLSIPSLVMKSVEWRCTSPSLPGGSGNTSSIVSIAAGSLLSAATLTVSSVGVLNFTGSKLVTTSSGGAMLTGSAELPRRLKHLSTTTKLPNHWEAVHDEVAYKYRLPNLNAAHYYAQLECIPDPLDRKRRPSTGSFASCRATHRLTRRNVPISAAPSLRLYDDIL